MLGTAWESRWLPDLRGISSVGRAPALQAGGHEFESRILHLVSLRYRICTLKTAHRRVIDLSITTSDFYDVSNALMALQTKEELIS